MERVISGLPWLPRHKYHVAVHEPTPRGTFVRVSFRKGACVCGDLQGRYAEACRWVKADESVDDALNDISAWVGETHGSCGGNALILCEPVAAPATVTTAAAVAREEVRMDVEATPLAAADAPMHADPVIARDSTHALSGAEMNISGSPPKAAGEGARLVAHGPRLLVLLRTEVRPPAQQAAVLVRAAPDVPRGVVDAHVDEPAAGGVPAADEERNTQKHASHRPIWHAQHLVMKNEGMCMMGLKFDT